MIYPDLSVYIILICWTLAERSFNFPCCRCNNGWNASDRHTVYENLYYTYNVWLCAVVWVTMSPHLQVFIFKDGSTASWFVALQFDFGWNKSQGSCTMIVLLGEIPIEIQDWVTAALACKQMKRNLKGLKIPPNPINRGGDLWRCGSVQLVHTIPILLYLVNLN
jgi:hypothetical protein